MTEQDLLLWLSSCVFQTRAAVKRLMKSFTPLTKLFSCDEETLLQAGVLPDLVRRLDDREKICAEIAEEKRYLAENGIRFLTAESADWPRRFLPMKDPPVWLYVRGTVPPEDEQTVSMVGSRGATNYGIRMAEFIARELARKKIGIVSGLAAGIDGASQAAAIAAGGTSYAVLGCGVNICYPKENYELFREILTSGRGGILSEYPPGENSAAWHFPDRNRLIAALGDCLAVVEARGPKSGSMITVDCALDLGKEVFAVPGRITDPLSRGCNDLIRSGASILTGPDDILGMLGVKKSGMLPPGKKDDADLSGAEKKVYALLSEEPRFLDSIARCTGFSPGQLMSILLKLELEGYVIQTSANYYAALLK